MNMKFSTHFQQAFTSIKDPVEGVIIKVLTLSPHLVTLCEKYPKREETLKLEIEPKADFETTRMEVKTMREIETWVKTRQKARK